MGVWGKNCVASHASKEEEERGAGSSRKWQKPLECFQLGRLGKRSQNAQTTVLPRGRGRAREEELKNNNKKDTNRFYGLQTPFPGGRELSLLLDPQAHTNKSTGLSSHERVRPTAVF